MDHLLLINLVLMTLLIGKSTAGETLHLLGSYNFLPYVKLTDELLNEKRLQIANAASLTITRFLIPTPEILIRNLNNNTSIEKLYLNDIIFEKMPDNNKWTKLHLPRMWWYQIFVRDVELQDDTEKNFQTLERYLLVENPKQRNKYYDFNVKLGTKIEVQHWTYGGDLYCHSNYFTPLLPSIGFKCNIISVFKQSIVLTTLPPNLKGLYLDEVGEIYETTTNGTRPYQLVFVHDILNYLPGLSRLAMTYSNPPNYQTLLDLSYLQRRLDWIYLTQAKIVNTESFEKEHRIHIGDFRCKLCKFEIMNYTNLLISTTKIGTLNSNYKTHDGFQRFISSIRNVESLDVDEIYNFNLDWLIGTADSLRDIKFANLNYQKPKLSFIFPKVYKLTLLNMEVIQLESILSDAFPNLEVAETTDTNPDLLRIFSGNKKLREIMSCTPETVLNGVNNALVEPRDFHRITYERKNNSWIIKEDYDFGARGIPYKVQQYINFYIWTIFIISSIGLIGNMLIIIVYGRQKPRTSTSYIILSLAFYDSLLLILTQVSLIYFQIKLMMDETPVNHKFWIEKSEGSVKNLNVNQKGFKALWYNLGITAIYLDWLFNIQSKWVYPLSKAAYLGSIYTTVLLTFERYFAICFPFRVKEYFNLKSVWNYFIIFGILSISLFAVKRFESFYSNEVFELLHGQCGFTYSWERSTSSKNPLNYRLYRLLFQGIFWNAIMYFIPIPLLLGLNYLIWRGVRRSAALRSQTNRDQDTIQITVMLVCVSLVFVVCNSISGSIVWYQLNQGADHLADVEIYSCLPLVINSSVNFIIYSMLGKKFREEFKNVLGEIWRKLWGYVCCQLFAGVWRRRQDQHRASAGGAENPGIVLQRL